MSSCWLPLPACGSGRPPDLAGSPFASAMVGEAARLGLDTARGLGWVATWRAGRGFFGGTRRLEGGWRVGRERGLRVGPVRHPRPGRPLT
jgi:hypothetical protein